MKRCTKCGEEKLFEEFRRNKKRRDGCSSSCKMCENKYQFAYREANREREIERRRIYYQANRDRELERNRAYHKTNRERVFARNRAYHEANRQHELEKSRAYRKANPEKIRIHGQRYRVRKRAGLVDPFTADELLAHYEREYSDDGCAYCDSPYEHDDHVVPLSRDGAHALDNLAPSCARCNLSKSDKTLPEWLGLVPYRPRGERDLTAS